MSFSLVEGRGKPGAVIWKGQAHLSVVLSVAADDSANFSLAGILPKKESHLLAFQLGQRGGIGRRAGLKIRYPLKMCRFEPDRWYHLKAFVKNRL